MPIPTWTRLLDHPIGQLAEGKYNSQNHILTYHNWNHILGGYNHAQYLFEFRYDVNLDLAWLGHDIVYDVGTEKEERSAAYIRELYQQYGPIPNVDIGLVESMIHNTIDHVAGEDSRIIMMDLADLTLKDSTARNFDLIKTESMRLYEIDEKVFAENNLAFMTGLRDRVMGNMKGVDSQFWSLVLRGIDQTTKMSEGILADT